MQTADSWSSHTAEIPDHPPPEKSKLPESVPVAAKTAAKTGDTSNVWMAAIVMLLAAGAAGVVVVYRKKQR